MENTQNTQAQPVAQAPASKNKRNLIIAGALIAAVVIAAALFINQRNNSPEARLSNLLNNIGNYNNLESLDATEIAKSLYGDIVESAQREAERENSQSNREESSQSSAAKTRPSSTAKLPSDLPSFAPLAKDAQVILAGKTVNDSGTEYYYNLRTYGVELDAAFEAMKEELTSKGWDITSESTVVFSMYEAARAEGTAQVTMIDLGTGEDTESGEREISMTIRVILK